MRTSIQCLHYCDLKEGDRFICVAEAEDPAQIYYTWKDDRWNLHARSLLTGQNHDFKPDRKVVKVRI